MTLILSRRRRARSAEPSGLHRRGGARLPPPRGRPKPGPGSARRPCRRRRIPHQGGRAAGRAKLLRRQDQRELPRQSPALRAAHHPGDGGARRRRQRRAAGRDGFGQRDRATHRRRDRRSPRSSWRAATRGRPRSWAAACRARSQLAAIAAVLPLRRAWMLDTDHARAESVAARARRQPRACASRRPRISAPRLRDSDVCVTCTPSRRAFVMAATWRPARSSPRWARTTTASRRSSPRLIASATLVVDVLAQCAEIGELQHVLAAGLMTREQVHAELGDVVVRAPARSDAPRRDHRSSTARAPRCRTSRPPIAVYEKARATGRGTEVTLDG